MPDFQIDIEIEVYCSCGEGLCRQATSVNRPPYMVVSPCEKCLGKARDEGYDEGYQEAKKECDEQR